MSVPPGDRWKRTSLFVFLCMFAASCFRPRYPNELVLQHVPTVLGLAALWLTDRRRPLSRPSYLCLLAFLSLHVVGARYLYSYVPYDRWSEALLGVNLTEHFGFRRNHYDRMVHFAYGVLLTTPAYRFATGTLRWRPLWASVAAFQFVLATSAVYEMAEWGVAITFAPDWADRYNGQQGDPWDAQKDMSLAALGALMNVGCSAVARAIRGHSD